MRALDWFEIPVLDLERALVFYRTLLGVDLERSQLGSSQMALLPTDGAQPGGALVENPQLGYAPSREGTIVYLHGGNDLGSMLARVEAAGGEVLLPKTHIGNQGFIAHLLDSEGNRIGLHSLG